MSPPGEHDEWNREHRGERVRLRWAPESNGIGVGRGQRSGPLHQYRPELSELSQLVLERQHLARSVHDIKSLEVDVRLDLLNVLPSQQGFVARPMGGPK